MLRTRWALFLTLTALLAAPLVVTLARNLSQWTLLAADVPLPRAQWRALYETSAVPCGSGPAAAPGCLASPSNPKLWSSPFDRADQDAHKARVNARPGEEYWVGIEITPEQKRQAVAREANVLVLGQVRGTHRIWLDGHLLTHGEWLDNEPLALTIPYEWLEGRGPLRLAISCRKTNDLNDAPDQLEDTPRLGLTRKAGATGWRRYLSFWNTTRPMIFLSLNLLLSWLFFGIWMMAPEKAEYFYIALLAQAFALFQLRYTDLFYLTTNRAFVNGLGLVMSILYAFTQMLAGFAFARLRAGLQRIAVVSCAVLCVALPLLIRDTIRQQVVSAYWLGLMADLGALLGATACFLQAWYLSTDTATSDGGHSAVSHRIRRLVLFGLGLTLLGALSHIIDPFVGWAAGTGNPPSLARLFLERSGPFFLLVSLGVVALSEYRAQSQLARSMPISKFHRREPLPTSVHGVLLSVDLKGSEKISRQGARVGRAGDLLELCVSHLWMAVSNNGGLVLRTQGDALQAIFSSEVSEHPLSSAFAAVDAMRRSLSELESQFASMGLTRHLPEQGLQFRGAVVEGAIRPIWQNYGGTLLAAWSETGDRNDLVELARLLELEREVAPRGAAQSVVITFAELATHLPAGARPGSWLFDKRSFTGKLGREYVLAAYRC